MVLKSCAELLRTLICVFPFFTEVHKVINLNLSWLLAHASVIVVFLPLLCSVKPLFLCTSVFWSHIFHFWWNRLNEMSQKALVSRKADWVFSKTLVWMVLPMLLFAACSFTHIWVCRCTPPSPEDGLPHTCEAQRGFFGYICQHAHSFGNMSL